MFLQLASMDVGMVELFVVVLLAILMYGTHSFAETLHIFGAVVEGFIRN